MKNLIYITLFLDKEPIKWLQLLLISIKIYSKMNFDILILTSDDLVVYINDIFRSLDIPINTMLLPCSSRIDYVNHRFKIFDYKNIDQYSKILYMDTDILVQNDLSVLFDLEFQDKLCALIEFNKTIESEHHGKSFFDYSTVDKTIPGRNAGVLLFKNTETMRKLFKTILERLYSLGHSVNSIISSDQQLLNYYCVTQDLFDNNILGDYIFLTYSMFPVSPEKNKKLIMNHFYGTMPNKIKIERMKDHMRYLLNTFKDLFINKSLLNHRYVWNDGYILFKENQLETKWGNGTYRCVGHNLYELIWNSTKHILLFNDDYSKYVSMRVNDMDIIYGYLDVSFHVLIATKGRRTLQRMLDSLAPQLNKRDCLTIVYDGKNTPPLFNISRFSCEIQQICEPKLLGHWGHGIRNKYGKLLKRRDFILHADDDNIYEPDSFKLLRKSCLNLDTLYFTKIFSLSGEITPVGERIEFGKIDTGSGIIPYDLNPLGFWSPKIGGDGEYYIQIVSKAKRVKYLQHFIYTLRPN